MLGTSSGRSRPSVSEELTTQEPDPEEMAYEFC